MNKKIVIANWKMNPQTAKGAVKIFNEIKKSANKLKKLETVICPPFVHLLNFNFKLLNLKLGAQNVFWEEKGSYTGEISSEMLKSLGVKYVIIGHSERRENLGETNEMINKKIKTALKKGFKVIFCIGEKQRDENASFLHFVKNEIEEGLKGIPRKSIKNLVIAYEPIWAIGKKGKDADKPEDILQMSIYIRRVLLGIIGKDLSRGIPVLYGGSVEPENAKEILGTGGVQGFLVGHASLVPAKFIKILKITSQS